ncbi:MAG: adenosine-specific kinase [Palaeococcus sp.]|uniref:adenosine-specific kinase n=1 Tax=Palaeococcus sp. (in: euryarchaeotes) TaxID=2820298 RepID=UPI0025E7C8BD|nr:adenosine-specific kinase [Palaeococcus sp. (in: euryarchaeotes)]MCD6558848.1 adenosine-specific kinase [Palaeococcus sp. (in: euryarchaeotes)]
MVKIEVVDIEKPEGVECIIGQGNFSIFTVDDLAKALLTTVLGIKFGIAMNEAKPQLTRFTGNDKELEQLAAKNALAIGGGHVFVVLMRKAFPINVLNTIKLHPAVATVYGASENPLQVIVAETELGRAVLGIVDGKAANTIETEEQKKERRELVERIGYTID